MTPLLSIALVAAVGVVIAIPIVGTVLLIEWRRRKTTARTRKRQINMTHFGHEILSHSGAPRHRNGGRQL